MGSTIWWLLLYFVILLYGNLGFKVMVDSGCPKSKPPNPQSKPPDIVNLWYLVILDLLIRGAQKVKKTIHYIYIYIISIPFPFWENLSAKSPTQQSQVIQ